MSRLLFLIAAITIATAPADAIDPHLSRWQPFVTEAAIRFGLPGDWIYRIMAAESGGENRHDDVPIRSRAGAIGLMQVMPATWAELRGDYRLGTDPDDPHDNIIAGAAYLRRMVDRFGYPGAIAAYNAGPARYAAYLAHATALPAETLAYLAKVTGGRSSRPSDGPLPDTRQSLFALEHLLPDDRAASSGPTSDAELFAVRKGMP